MTNTVNYSKKVSALSITPSDINDLITGGSDELPEIFLAIADNLINRLAKYTVQYGYKIYPASILLEEMTVGETVFNLDKEVQLLMKNVEKVAVFACTIDSTLEHELNIIKDASEQYIADVIGTVIVEKASGLLLTEVQNKFSSLKLKTTNTISPGNCGWPIQDQQKLFGLLPDHFLGIALNSSGMMMPVKSLSGIVGIGKMVSFKHADCRMCASKNCLYRKN